MDPIKIPASLNEETVFISASELKLSMRQLVIILIAGAIWFFISNFMASLFGVNNLFMFAIFSWILFVGIAFAFVKKDGKKLDEYLGEKWAFEMHPKTYVLKQEDDDREINNYLVEEEVIIDDIYNFSNESMISSPEKLPTEKLPTSTPPIIRPQVNKNTNNSQVANRSLGTIAPKGLNPNIMNNLGLTKKEKRGDE